jgi:hypothetical protein
MTDRRVEVSLYILWTLSIHGRKSWAASLHYALPWKRGPSTHWIGDWVGTREVRGPLKEKICCPCQELPSAHSVVTAHLAISTASNKNMTLKSKICAE